MKKLVILPFLLIAIMIHSSCRSAEFQIRTERRQICNAENLAITDGMNSRNLTVRNNACVEHAKNLADCLRASQCVLELTEWERDCSIYRTEELESSLAPGIFKIRRKCPIQKPPCLKRKD